MMRDKVSHLSKFILIVAAFSLIAGPVCLAEEQASKGGTSKYEASDADYWSQIKKLESETDALLKESEVPEVPPAEEAAPSSQAQEASSKPIVPDAPAPVKSEKPTAQAQTHEKKSAKKGFLWW